MVKAKGLRIQAVMSFHACGGNVGDYAQVPLPEWVLKVSFSSPNILYIWLISLVYTKSTQGQVKSPVPLCCAATASESADPVSHSKVPRQCLCCCVPIQCLSPRLLLLCFFVLSAVTTMQLDCSALRRTQASSARTDPGRAYQAPPTTNTSACSPTRQACYMAAQHWSATQTSCMHSERLSLMILGLPFMRLPLGVDPAVSCATPHMWRPKAGGFLG